jgi:hypothetical protein
VGKAASTDGTTNLYFANYTRWGPQAANYLSSPSLEDIAFSLGVEHHLKQPALDVAARQLGKQGWRVYSTPAQQASKETGSSAGAWVLAKKNLTTHGRHCKPGNAWPDSTLQGHFASCIARAANLDFLIGAVYLESGVGTTGGNNPERLEALASHLGTMKIPFILGGDWNATPQEMVAFATFIKGVIITPGNVEMTCTSGAGRMLDYVIVSNSLACQVEVAADLDSPWAPHCGLRIKLQKDVQTNMLHLPHLPLEIPKCQGPMRGTWQQYHEAALPLLHNQDFPYTLKPGTYNEELTTRFSQLSCTAELIASDRACIEEANLQSYIGKGQPFKMIDVPAQAPTRVGAYYVHEASTFWSALCARIKEHANCRAAWAKQTKGRAKQGVTTLTWLNTAALKVHQHWIEAKPRQQGGQDGLDGSSNEGFWLQPRRLSIRRTSFQMKKMAWTAQGFWLQPRRFSIRRTSF